jgi:uncharacterized phage protein (TIGR01671 family)
MDKSILICKAKDERNGKWVTGYYLDIGGGEAYLFNPEFSHFSGADDSGTTYHMDMSGFFPVINDTVVQSTGRKSARGQEVYEGDIVEAVVKYIDDVSFGKVRTKTVKGVVERNKEGYWQLKTEDPYLTTVGFYAVKKIKDVLGNIYDKVGAKENNDELEK